MASRIASLEEPTSGRPYPVPSGPFDDMHDSPEDLARFPDLPLAACQEITVLFDDKDEGALDFQKSHQQHVLVAAVSGALAILAVISGMALAGPLEKHPGSESALALAELIFVGVAIVTALHGHWLGKKEKWLALRHQAELCRQLKFQFLTDPSLWKQPDFLNRRFDKIQSYESEEALKDAVEDALPHGPFTVGEQNPRPEILQQMVRYYVDKRLAPQIEYLDNRAQRNAIKDHLAYLPVHLFFTSVIFAFLHVLPAISTYLLGKLAPRFQGPLNFLRAHAVISARLAFGFGFCAFLAAVLPALAASVRTWRSAFEFSRNESRFRATHKALCALGVRLDRSQRAVIGATGQAASWAEISQVFCWCEHIMQSEHIEWLRLMLETEWFG